MPVRLRPNSIYYQYDFTCNGVRFRGSTQETTRKEARAVEDAKRAAIQAGIPKAGKWKLRQVFGAYWDNHASHKRSAATMEYQLMMLSEYLGADTQMCNVTAPMILTYRARRKADNLSDASINREIELLRASFNYVHTMYDQRAPELPWKQLKLQEPPWRTRYLSMDEYHSLMNAAHPSIKPIIVCAVTTGLRMNNILELQWHQVKLKEAVIQCLVKGNKAHSVKIAAPLKVALSLMPHRTGLVFDKTNFKKRYLKAVADAGLEDFRFHDLRHTFASWARQKGADIADIKDALGHSEISMTMRYAHIEAETHDTAFDKVGQMFMSQSVSHRRVG